MEVDAIAYKPHPREINYELFEEMKLMFNEAYLIQDVNKLSKI